jgi:putative FmdB family regulatory protein
MARYDYRCVDCGHVFEVEHPMLEHPEVLCPECKGQCSRVFSASAIRFSGSGFYNTDQRGGGSSTPATSGSSESSGGSKCAHCSGGSCDNCA